MIINIFFLIFIILFSSILSYLTFPLYADDYNFTSLDSPIETIEKMLNSKLYINITIGSDKINVKSLLVLDREEFMIAGNNIINHTYNETSSKSYNCSYCKSKDFYYGWYCEGILSTEDFTVENEQNETKLIHNMKFILGTKSLYSKPPQGFIGLHLPYYDSDVEYNLIRSLKNANAIKSYNWFLYFGKEHKFIVDGFPHDLDSKKYNAEKNKTVGAINGGYYTVWGLYFTDIYIFTNNTRRNISNELHRKADIKIDYKLIIAPEETAIILDQEFFDEYYNKNICFKGSLGEYREGFIYCKNIKEFEVTKFKTIYFKSLGLYRTFSLNFNDLFYYKDDYVYFLLLFKNSYWTFGELFLRKYYLVFNQDAKAISFYGEEEEENEQKNKNEENKKNKKNKFEFKLNFTNVLLLLILITIIVVGIVLYIKKGKRKNRANELDDDNYEYDATINANEDAKNKILEN